MQQPEKIPFKGTTKVFLVERKGKRSPRLPMAARVYLLPTKKEKIERSGAPIHVGKAQTPSEKKKKEKSRAKR